MTPRRPYTVGTGEAAPPVSGLTPGGAPVSVELAAGAHTLVFITSSCAPCRDVWDRLASDAPAPGVIAVTPDPATEDLAKVVELAAGRVAVVMSTEAWLRYAAGPAPWRVDVEDGRVTASAPA